LNDLAATKVIAVDWGTSSFRAYRLDGQGRILERKEAPMGILKVPDRDFAGALGFLIFDWARLAPQAPVVMSGMIGSRQGWRETRYLACPVGPEEIAGAAEAVPWRDGRKVWIAPGLSCRDASGVPDVMRGEEVQILGALEALGSGRHLICLPGTHGKWATVQDRRIIRFATHMTGEVFDVLSRHSILGRLMAKEDNVAEDDESARWFGEGLARSEADGGLLHHLFGVRSRGLMDEVPAEGLRSYLSGLLIGHEVAAATADPVDRVHLLGTAGLGERYAAALTRRGRAVAHLDPDAVAAGLFQIAARLPAEGESS
jgi:2-dehydro-3-deoxygalactonokinase